MIHLLLMAALTQAEPLDSPVEATAPIAEGTAPAAAEAPPDFGNRELTLAIGYGVPIGPDFYTNPFGSTVQPRLRWAFRSADFEFLLGPGGLVSYSPPQPYFDKHVSGMGFALGPDLGFRLLIRDTPLQLGLDFAASLRWVAYGIGDAGNGHLNYSLGFAPVIGCRLLPQVTVGVEVRAERILGPMLPDNSPDLWVITPSAQGTFRF